MSTPKKDRQKKLSFVQGEVDDIDEAGKDEQSQLAFALWDDIHGEQSVETSRKAEAQCELEDVADCMYPSCFCGRADLSSWPPSTPASSPSSLIDDSMPFILFDPEDDMVIHSAETEEELLATAYGYRQEGDKYCLVIYERKAILE